MFGSSVSGGFFLGCFLGTGGFLGMGSGDFSECFSDSLGSFGVGSDVKGFVVFSFSFFDGIARDSFKNKVKLVSISSLFFLFLFSFFSSGFSSDSLDSTISLTSSSLFFYSFLIVYFLIKSLICTTLPFASILTFLLMASSACLF